MRREAAREGVKEREGRADDIPSRMSITGLVLCPSSTEVVRLYVVLTPSDM